MATVTPPPAPGPAVGDKGLKKDALGFVSSVVIGVASTAPGYSLAASLGLVVAISGVGLQAPAVLLVAFIPMLLIASAYYYMNRADPDCGTTFSWATRALGPWAGWMGGWAIVVADVIVMANLAQIAGLYSFLLVGWDSAAASTFAVTLVGVVWIAVMTAICVIGIELSARTQVGLLSAEILTLTLFAIVAFVKVAAGSAGPEAVDFSVGWLNPFAVDSIAALGLMIAFYYGMTGFACAIYYRRALLRSVKSFLLIGVGPTLGGLMLLGIFVKSCVDLSSPENSESGNSWLGVGPPLVIGVGFLVLGAVLMVLWRLREPEFFRRRPEVADPRLLDQRA